MAHRKCPVSGGDSSPQTGEPGPEVNIASHGNVYATKLSTLLTSIDRRATGECLTGSFWRDEAIYYIRPTTAEISDTHKMRLIGSSIGGRSLAECQIGK